MTNKAHLGAKLWLLASLACSAAAAADDRFALLEGTVEQELRSNGIPGAAIGVIEGDQLTFVKGFGIASVETNERVSPDMLFRLGSTTKMFTATAMLLLSEQGKLQLDAPIGSVVSGLSPSVAAVTTDQLLSHKSGLSDEVSPFGLHDDSALGAYIRSWNAEKFFTTPGSVYSYSNLGYSLAGFVIEAASGMAFADQMNSSVFNPLGMNRTTFRPTVAMTYRLAIGHVPVPKGQPKVARPLADNVPRWPSGSMFSNVSDLSRFLIAFMNEGRLEGKQVLRPALIETLATPHADPPTERFKYGYGLEILSLQNERMLEHAGSFSGYGSFIRIFPDKKVAIVVLTNLTNGALPRTIDVATEISSKIKPPGVEAAVAAIPMTRAEVERYVGKYSQGSGDWNLVAEQGKLYILIDSQRCEVSKLGENRFRATLPGNAQATAFRLVMGANGRAEYLFRASRSFKRDGGG